MRRPFAGPATPRRSVARLAAAAFALLLAPSCGFAAALAIVGVDVVDPVDGTIARDRTVVVDADRIVAVGAPDATSVPRDAVRVDGRGRWLIPGLVDAHVHLFNRFSGRPPNEWALPLFVANGVTTVREMSADAASVAIVRRWHEEAARGARIAPRIHAAIAVSRPYPESFDDVAQAARTAGADALKVFSEFPPESLAALGAAARAHGLRVVGHAPSHMRATDAVAAGLATVEHLFQVYEACASGGDEVIAARRAHGSRDVRDPDAALLDAYDDRTCRRAARVLARHPHVQVPTLVLLRRASPEPDDIRDDPRWPLLRVDEQERWSRILAALGPAHDALDRDRAGVARRIVAVLQDAGVPIAAGSDAPMPRIFPGWSLHDELALLVDAGLTPAAALRAATVEGYRALGVDPASASIAKGSRADLVLLDADPLADIANTRRIRAVVVGGRLLDRDALDRIVQPGTMP